MKTPANHPAEAGSGIFGPVHNRVLFAAACPKCRQQVLQDGYSRVLLCAYLDIEYEIEAYCATCDELWTISYEERRALISALLPAHD